MTRPAAENPSGHRIPWFEAALLLVGYGTLTALSIRFRYEVAPVERPTALFVALLAALSVLWIIASWRAFDRPPRLGPVLLWALAFRAIVAPSYPIEDDDIYRYLWDGKVVARGLDPYLVSPSRVKAWGGAEVEAAPEPEADAPAAASPEANAERSGRDDALKEAKKRALLASYAAVRDASASNREILERVDRPELVSIYPEITQLVFSVGSRIVPASWSIPAQVTAMKLLIGLFDLGTLAMLILILRTLGLPEGWTLLYAWCPLVLNEVWNSGHMDSVPTFWLLVSLWLLLHASRYQRESWFGTLLAGVGGLALGAAVGAKVFALATVPILTRWLGFVRGGLLVLCGAIAVVLLGGIWAESAVERQHAWGAFLFFENANSAVYFWIERIAGAWLPDTAWHVPFFGWTWTGPARVFVARAICGGLVAIVLSFLAWRTRSRTPPHVILRRVFVSLVAVLILGPVAYPWYLVWSLPLLAFAPGRTWLALPGLFSLYYLKFSLEARPETLGFATREAALEFFHEWIVTLEWSAIVIVLLIEALVRRGDRGRRWRELGLPEEDRSSGYEDDENLQAEDA